MTAKTVSLSVHRNTVEGRRKRDRAKDAQKQVMGVMRQEDIRAWAYVGIAADGGCFALWDTGGIVPMRVFPGVVREVLSDDINNSGAKDDFRAALTTKSQKD